MEVTDIQVDSNRPSKRSLEVSIAVKIKLKKQKDVVDSDDNYYGEEVEEEEGEEDEEEAGEDGQYQYHEYIHEYESGFSEAPFDDLHSFESDRGESMLQHHHHDRMVPNWSGPNTNGFPTSKTHSRKSSDSNATFDMSVISEEDETSNKSEPIILQDIQADKLHVRTEEKEKEKVTETNRNQQNIRNDNLQEVDEPIIIAEKLEDILSDILSDIVVDDFILIRTDEEYFLPDEVLNETENTCEEEAEESLTIEKETDWVSNKRTASMSTYSDYGESSESPRITSDEMRSSNEEEKEEETEIEESCNNNDSCVTEDEIHYSYSNEVDLLGSFSTGAEILDSYSTETDLLGSFSTDLLGSCRTEHELTDSCVTEAEMIVSCNPETEITNMFSTSNKLLCSVGGKVDLCSEARELVYELKKEVEVLEAISSEFDQQAPRDDVEELHVTDIIQTELVDEETNVDLINTKFNQVSELDCDELDDVEIVKELLHEKEANKNYQLYDFEEGYKEMDNTGEQIDQISVFTTTTTTTTHVFQNELNFDWDIRSPKEEGCLSNLSTHIQNDYVSAFKEYKNELMDSEIINETIISISHDLSDGIVDSSGYFSEYTDRANMNTRNICTETYAGLEGKDENKDMVEESKQNNSLDDSNEEGIGSWSNAKDEDHSKSLEVGGDSGRDRLTPTSLLTGNDISDIEMDLDLPLDESVTHPKEDELPRPANFNWCSDLSCFPEDTFSVTRDECVYKDEDDKLVISTKSRNYELTELCEKIDQLNESYDLAELKEQIDELNKNDDDFPEISNEKEINDEKKNSGKILKKNYEFTKLSEKVDVLNDLLEPVYEKKVSRRLRYKNNKERFPALLAQNTNEELPPKPKRSHSIHNPSEKVKYPKTPCPIEKNSKTVDFWHGDKVLCINGRVFDFGKPVKDMDYDEIGTPWQYTNRNSQLTLMDQSLSKLGENNDTSKDGDTSLRSVDDPLMDFTRSIDETSSLRSVDEPLFLHSIDDPISLHSVDERMSLRSSFNDMDMELPHDDDIPMKHIIDDLVPSNEQIFPANQNDTLEHTCPDENDSLDQIVDTLSASIPDERVLSVEDLKSLPEEENNAFTELKNTETDKTETIESNTFITVSDIPKKSLSGMNKEMKWFTNKRLDFRWDSGIGSEEDLSNWRKTKTKTVNQTEQNSSSTDDEITTPNSESRNKDDKQKKKKSDMFSKSTSTDCSFNEFFRDMKLFIVDPINQTARSANEVLNFDWDKCSHTCDDEVSTKDILEDEVDALSERKRSIADMDHINLFSKEPKTTLDLSELDSLIPTEIGDDQITTTFESESDSYRELIEIERFEQLEKLCKESERFPDFQWLTEESAKFTMNGTDPQLGIRDIGPDETFSASVQRTEGTSKDGTGQEKTSVCWNGIIENTCDENVIFDLPISWRCKYDTVEDGCKENAPWNNQSDYETEMYYMNDSTTIDETCVEEKLADLSTICESGEDSITFMEEQGDPEESSIEWFAIKQLGMNWNDMVENTVDTSQEFSDHVDILSAISEEELSLSESTDVMRDSTSPAHRQKAKREKSDSTSWLATNDDTHQHGKGINECFTCKSLDTIDEKLRELSSFIADGNKPTKCSHLTQEYKNAQVKTEASEIPCSNDTRSIPKKSRSMLPTIEMSTKVDRTISPSQEPRSMIPIPTKRIKGVDCMSITKRKKKGGLNEVTEHGSHVTNSTSNFYSQKQNHLLNEPSDAMDERCEIDDDDVMVDSNTSNDDTMLFYKTNNDPFKFTRNNDFGFRKRQNSCSQNNVDGDRNDDVFDVKNVGNNVTNVRENDDVPSDVNEEKSDDEAITDNKEAVSQFAESIVTIEDFVIITQDEIQYVTENMEKKENEANDIVPSVKNSNSLEMKDFTTVDENEDEPFPSIPLSFSWDKKTSQDNWICRDSNKGEENEKENKNRLNKNIDDDLDNDSKNWTKNLINKNNNKNRIVSCKNKNSNRNDDKENLNLNHNYDEIDTKNIDCEINETNSDSITKKFMIELTKRSKKGMKKGLNYINGLDGDLHDTKCNIENDSIKVIKNSVKQVTIAEKGNEEVVRPLKENSMNGFETKRCSKNCQWSTNNTHNVTIEDIGSDKTDGSSVVSAGDLGSNGDLKEVCNSCGKKVEEDTELTSSELESDAEDQVLKIFVDLSIE